MVQRADFTVAIACVLAARAVLLSMRASEDFGEEPVWPSGKAVGW